MKIKCPVCKKTLFGELEEDLLRKQKKHFEEFHKEEPEKEDQKKPSLTKKEYQEAREELFGEEIKLGKKAREELQAVTIDSKAFEKTIEKYPIVSRKELEKWIFDKCEYYSKQTQEKLETLGFEKGMKKEWNDKIKDFVLLININYKELDLKEVREKLEPTGLQIFADKRELAKKYLENNPLYYDKNKLWWVWNHEEYFYERVDDVDILNSVNEAFVVDTINSKQKTEIVEALKQEGRKLKPEPIKDTWIQFKNKIYDIETDEEFEATPKYFVVNPISWELGETEGTPEIDKLFSSWVTKDEKEILYEMIAFCLAPKYFIHRIFCLIGSGSNGKSTFLKILTKFMGQNNITSSSLNLIIKERFEGSKLLHKLICLMGETNFNLISNTSFLKNLTGEDLVRCEFKGKDIFDFENYAKLIMATNSLPPTADRTDGYYRRWKIIDFSNKFPEEKDVLSEIPDQEYNNLALKCLNILKGLWKDRKFSGDVDFEERRKQYEEKANPLMKFLEENYEEDINKEVLFADFFKKARDYFVKRGLRDISAISISRQLKNEGYDIKQLTKDGVNARYVIGIYSKNDTNDTNDALSHSNPYVVTSRKKRHLEHMSHSQRELKDVGVQKDEK